MTDLPVPSEDPIARLVSRLHAVRTAHEGQPAGRRRAALARELDVHLAELPAAERRAVLEHALGTMRPPERPTGGDGGGAEAAELRTELDLVQAAKVGLAQEAADLRAEADRVQAEKTALVQERDALRATRDALLRDNAQLRDDIKVKATSIPTVAAPAGSIEIFRSGLKDAMAGKQIDPEQLGLAAGEVRLFRLTQELALFVHMLERARIAFLNQLEIGPASAMGTVMLKGAQDQVRKQILAVLNDEEGSIRKLRKAMGAQNRFVLGVPDAFQSAIPKAVAALLAKLDPDPMLARSKKILTDYERAWTEFARTHSDLSNLTPDEIWETYFRQAFREKLDEWTKSDA